MLSSKNNQNSNSSHYKQDSNLISQLNNEHHKIESLMTEIDTAIKSDNSIKAISKKIEDLCNTILTHIDIENHGFYQQFMNDDGHKKNLDILKLVNDIKSSGTIINGFCNKYKTISNSRVDKMEFSLEYNTVKSILKETMEMEDTLLFHLS